MSNDEARCRVLRADSRPLFKVIYLRRLWWLAHVLCRPTILCSFCTRWATLEEAKWWSAYDLA